MALALALTAKPAAAAAVEKDRTDVASRLEHSRDVVEFFRQHSWMLATNRAKCSQVPWHRTCAVARRLSRKHARLIAHLQSQQIPVGEREIRAYIYRTYGRVEGQCMATIIDWENVVWDPTIDYGMGHGNVNEAYGLPQANPGYKMASAGADWRTNPITQLKWMYTYSVQRYGSLCGAFAHRRAYHMY